MSKRLAYLILSLFAVLTLLVGFVLSPLATPLLRWGINTAVDELYVDEVAGSIYGGFSLQGIRYDTLAANVAVAQVELAIDWQCTTTEHVCLSTLHIAQPQLTLHNTPEESAANDAPVTHSLTALPIGVTINDIQLSDIQVTQGDTRITLAALHTQLTFKQQLHVTNTELSQLTLSVVGESPPPEPFSGLRYQAPILNRVWISVDAFIDGFVASDIVYKTVESTEQIKQITFNDIQLKGHDVQWHELAVTHEQGRGSTSGKISLNNDYPVSVSVDGQVLLQDQKNQQVQLEANGTLANLAINADLTGVVNGKAELLAGLLDAKLAVQGQITWPEQAVNHAGINNLKAGRIAITGEMGDYQLTVDSAAQVEQLDDVSFHADLSLSDKSLIISQLDLSVLQGHVITQGQLNFTNGLSGKGSTRVTTLDATPLLQTEGVPSAISTASLQQASWQYGVRQTEQGINLLISEIDALFNVDDRQAHLTGQAVYSQAQDLAVAMLGITQPDTDNTVALTAQVLNQRVLNVTSQINAPNLQHLLTGLNGAVTGDIKIQGEWSNPSFNIELHGQHIEVAKRYSTFLHEQGVITGDVSVTGELAQHSASFSSTLKDYGIQGKLEGKYDKNTYSGSLASVAATVLGVKWQLDQPAQFSYNTQVGNASLQRHCWSVVASEGALCIDGVDYTNDILTWQANGDALPVGLWASNALAELTTVSDSGTLSLQSQGTFALDGGVNATAKLRLEPSIWTVNPANPIDIAVNQLNAEVNLTPSQLTTDIQFHSNELGGLGAELTLAGNDSVSWSNRQINGELTVDKINLTPFTEFSPSINQLAGVINGQVQVSGNVQKPQLNGALTLQQGEVDIEQSPLTLSGWTHTFEFAGTQATMDGSFMLGDGTGSVKGKLLWEDSPLAELSIDTAPITIEHEQIKLAVSPNLTAQITAEQVNVTGDINLPYARIKIDELPENAITPSRDVYLRGEPKSTDPLENIFADITLHIDEDKTQNVKLDAFGLTANLHGELQINNQPALVGYGDLQILDGRYKAYGQNLIIRRGEVQFNGPIGQPFLFVEAIRDPDLTADNVIAGVRIDGAASKPNVALFSEPVMEQSQNLLYLLNGSGSLNSGSGDENYKAALVGLGLSRSGSVTSQIGESLGIEDLSFSTTGQGDSTQVSMTGSLAKNLSVRFGIGLFDNSQEVAIRYQILPHLYVEAVQRLSEAVSLIDLYYEFALGDPLEEEDNDTQNAQASPQREE